MNVIDFLDIANIIDEVNGNREPVRRRNRLDPFSLPDREFRVRFRFSKDGVRQLTEIIRPGLEHGNNRGLPFTPEQVVCCGLDFFSGGHFQRTQGICSGSAKSTVQEMAYYFLDELLKLKKQVIAMPIWER